MPMKLNDRRLAKLRELDEVLQEYTMDMRLREDSKENTMRTLADFAASRAAPKVDEQRGKGEGHQKPTSADNGAQDNSDCLALYQNVADLFTVLEEVKGRRWVLWKQSEHAKKTQATKCAPALDDSKNQHGVADSTSAGSRQRRQVAVQAVVDATTGLAAEIDRSAYIHVHFHSSMLGS